MTADETTDKQDRLRYWVQHLSEREMPAFANTARLIAGEAARGESTASELARLILQDASMTTRLLRIANSIHYNPSRNPINTVSRAIVVLGFEAVRNLCLSIAIIDTLIEGHNKARVMEQMARSFHAAVQARSLAEKRRDKSPEEVFIAALLYHLGSMAFWCFAEDIDAGAAARVQTLAEAGEDPETAAREVLGFTLQDLTRALNREWHLSSLLDTALEDVRGDDPRVSNVSLGHEIAAASRDGWNTPKVESLLERAAESLYLPREQATRMIHENARDAAQTMSRLGAPKAGNLIPVPQSLSTAATESVELEDPGRRQFLEPDPELQLDILREIGQLLTEERPQLNLLLEMALEGVYRGVGMDRALVALLNPERTMVRAKHTLGWDRQQQAQLFRFRLSTPPKSVIDYVVERNTALWVTDPPDPGLSTLLTPEVRQLTGDSPFFLLPIDLHGRVIGLMYADRRPSRRPLDQDSFNGFQLFGQQLRLGLAYIKRR